MMTEDQKSIWKAPWRGTRHIVTWHLLLAAAAFVIVLVFGLLWGPGDRITEHLALAAIVSVGLTILAWLMWWLACWRRFRWVMFGGACLATLLALAHLVENLRGQAAWKAFQQEAAARGERLDFSGVIPPPVPDAENCAMAPLFEGLRNEMDPEWRRRHTGPGGLTNANAFTLTPYRTNGSSAGLSVGGWQTGERADLAAWQRYYRDPEWDGDSDATAGMALRYGLVTPPTNADLRASAPVVNEFRTAPQPQSPAADVLLALSKFDPLLEELREASRRPYARFPVRYEDGFNALLPHLAKLRGASQLVTLRSIAALAGGKPDQAYRDVALSFRLIECTRDEPLLISHLVRIAQMQLALQPVWEGLSDHRWSDAQLAGLEEQLNKLDFLSDYNVAMRGERTLSIWAVEWLRRTRDVESLGVGGESARPTAAAAFKKLFFRLAAPRGWFDQNKVALGRLHLHLIQPAVDQEARVCSPAALRQMDAAVGKQLTRLSPYNFFSRLLVPALGKAAEKFARGQAGVDLARVACALERHRLAHGGYPESLDALTPTFLGKLPHDVINGQPLKYRRTAEGRFLLYSVGWNEADDDGQIALTSKGNVDWNKGDWVWPTASR